ncbi:MAG: oligosaccharide flippase family protein, partial [Clostridia bacterium]|nr:oligosaccharide flippase family protein [Clostridia bacterium]
FFERIGAQLVSTIVSIILARILMPEDYSVVSIVTIFFSFCNIFITSGLSTARVQNKDVDEIDY